MSGGNACRTTGICWSWRGCYRRYGEKKPTTSRNLSLRTDWRVPTRPIGHYVVGGIRIWRGHQDRSGLYYRGGHSHSGGICHLQASDIQGFCTAFDDFTEVSHRHIGESYVHIDVSATLKNSSRVKVDLIIGLFLLQKIAPVEDQDVIALHAQVFVDRTYEDILWPVIDEVHRSWKEHVLVIEPGDPIKNFVNSSWTLPSRPFWSIHIFTIHFRRRLRVGEPLQFVTLSDIIQVGER